MLKRIRLFLLIAAKTKRMIVERYDSKVFGQYLKVLSVSLLLMLSTVIIACSEGIENVIEIQISNDRVEATFLNLEEIHTTEGGFVSETSRKEKITWFDTYGSDGHIYRQTQDIRGIIKKDFGVEIPDGIDMIPDEESFIAISIGRRLESLYYFVDGWRMTDGGIIAYPIFEREYKSGAIFLYRVSPLPTRRFTCNWMFSGLTTQLLNLGNIPFDMWGNPASVKFEFIEPICGQINVQDAYLRMYPTRNSMITTHYIEGDRTTILGYVEDGEELDGCSRWYLIEWYLEGEYYDRVGYIHSSFVSY